MEIEPHARVANITMPGAISIDEKLTLRSIAAVLADARVGVVLVRMPDDSVAVVSERDVVQAIADGADADEVWAADIARTPLVVAELDEPIVDVADRMVDEDIRHVAVIERDQIVGVVSTRDVLPVLVEHARTVV